jgi:ribonuclease HI
MSMQVVKYLNTTVDDGLKYHKNDKLQLEMHVDADWGGSLDRKSTSGIAILLNNKIISFKSKKQPMIALSTAEAEYIAVSEGLRILRGIMNVFKELKLIFESPVKIYNDNVAAIQLLNSDKLLRRTKHIELKFLYSRQELKKKDIELLYIDTDHNLADGLTKILTGIKFKKFTEKILN